VPEGWGLLSVGTGAPAVIVPAREREPVERLSPFELALVRAAVVTGGEHAASDAGDAPVVEVIRAFLSRRHVGLACHHAAMSLAKTTPERHLAARAPHRATCAPRPRPVQRSPNCTTSPRRRVGSAWIDLSAPDGAARRAKIART
jgi:hypothetical protein